MKPKFKKILRLFIDIVKEEILSELEEKNNNIDFISDDLDEPMSTHEIIEYYKSEVSRLTQ